MLWAIHQVEFDDDHAVVCGEGNDIFFNEGRFHIVGFLWGGGGGFSRMCSKSEEKGGKKKWVEFV